MVFVKNEAEIVKNEARGGRWGKSSRKISQDWLKTERAEWIQQWLCEHNKALIGQLEASGNRFRAKGKASSNAERKAVVGKIGKA